MNQPKRSRGKKDDDYSGPDGPALRRVMDAFLAHLVAEREARGLRQYELAERAGLAAGHYSNVERGARGMTLPTFVRIAKGLSMRPAELATYLGGLPGIDASNGVRVVSVATDGTVARESLHDALGELKAARAERPKQRGQLHDARAKSTGAKKHRVG